MAILEGVPSLFSQKHCILQRYCNILSAFSLSYSPVSGISNPSKNFGPRQKCLNRPYITMCCPLRLIKARATPKLDSCWLSIHSSLNISNGSVISASSSSSRYALSPVSSIKALTVLANNW